MQPWRPKREWIEAEMEARAPTRFCVFCGERPVRKTREHVVPRWLIALTGDPKRALSVGPLMSRFVLEEEIVTSEFSWDSLAFPACGQCNQRFSQLEANAQATMSSILAGGELSAGDFDIFLDWFDKVRIGLWLGYHQYLDRNVWGVVPHFHIQTRIGEADRALMIYRATGDTKGLHFAGVRTPAFAHCPSCFTLVVNGVFLQNVSHQFALAKQMGLPYPHRMEIAEDESLRAVLMPGTASLRLPVFEFRYDDTCTVIAQPMFPRCASTTENAETAALYDTDYVRGMTLRSNRAIPLLCNRGRASFCPLEPSSAWFDDRTVELDDLLLRNAIQTLRIQNHIIQSVSMSKDMPEERKRASEFEFAQCVNANDRVIAHLVHERLAPQIGANVPRNAPCPCGGGKKYKHCCGRRALRNT